MSDQVRWVPRPEARPKLLDALAYGFQNFGNAIDTSTKGHTPVRGGFRSFDPDGPVGGTLRRSIHVVVYLDGVRISPRSADDNGTALPDYVPRMGLVLYVGSNSGYGFWVHQGTSKMPGRPFLQEGFDDERGRAPELIAAGSRARLRQ